MGQARSNVLLHLRQRTSTARCLCPPRSPVHMRQMHRVICPLPILTASIAGELHASTDGPRSLDICPSSSALPASAERNSLAASHSNAENTCSSHTHTATNGLRRNNIYCISIPKQLIPTKLRVSLMREYTSECNAPCSVCPLGSGGGETRGQRRPAEGIRVSTNGPLSLSPSLSLSLSLFLSLSHTHTERSKQQMNRESERDRERCSCARPLLRGRRGAVAPSNCRSGGRPATPS